MKQIIVLPKCVKTRSLKHHVWYTCCSVGRLDNTASQNQVIGVRQPRSQQTSAINGQLAGELGGAQWSLQRTWQIGPNADAKDAATLQIFAIQSRLRIAIRVRNIIICMCLTWCKLKPYIKKYWNCFTTTYAFALSKCVKNTLYSKRYVNMPCVCRTVRTKPLDLENTRGCVSLRENKTLY